MKPWISRFPTHHQELFFCFLGPGRPRAEGLRNAFDMCVSVCACAPVGACVYFPLSCFQSLPFLFWLFCGKYLLIVVVMCVSFLFLFYCVCVCTCICAHAYICAAIAKYSLKQWKDEFLSSVSLDSRMGATSGWKKDFKMSTAVTSYCSGYQNLFVIVKGWSSKSVSLEKHRL